MSLDKCLNPRRPHSSIRLLLTRVGINPDKGLKVLDLTYGQGLFWFKFPNIRIVGFDVRKLQWKVAPTCFVQDKAQNWYLYRDYIVDCLGGNPDIVAVDPPFSKRLSGSMYDKTHYYESFAEGTVEEIIESALEAGRYFKSLVLIRYRTLWNCKIIDYLRFKFKWMKDNVTSYLFVCNPD